MAKAKAKSAEPEPAPAGEGSYTAVARRYRPRQFADLIGQEHVSTALTNAITSGRIAHAYLFTGARGTGKTSTARILAKALNCEKGPTATPCDRCDICLRIAEGEDTDAVEIDGASNNKAEEARELRGTINFRPQRARFKIYIVDEVHMLSTAAFNVLLKTLEEPPPHVKFIFATTEAQKIPITILSRCQRFDFAHINAARVFETLKHIVAKEGLKAEDAALRIVAKRAAGSMRDAQTLLDQLLSVTTGTLTAESIHAILGTADDDRVADLADAIFKKDAKAAVEFVAGAADRGLQLGEFLDQLLDYWRALMLVSVGGPTVADAVASPTVVEKVVAHAASTNLDTILAGLDVLTTAKGRMKFTVSFGLLVEMTVVRLCRLDDLVSVQQLARAVSEGVPSLPAPIRSVTNEPTVKKNSPTAVEPVPDAQPTTPRSLSAENLKEIWPAVLTDVGGLKGRALHHAGLPAILGPNKLALRFPSTYSLPDDEAAGHQESLVAALKRTTGRDWVVLIEKSAGDADGHTPARATPAANAASRQKTLLEHPLFKRIAERLGGQMVRVEDGFNPTAPAKKLAIPADLAAAATDDDGDAPPPDADPEPDEE